jgi:RNA polymerase sigma-70 factor (ECF subfamily)
LFGILVRENAAMLMVYLRSAVRDPAIVDDLFQETMLVAWKTIDRFDRSRPFGPWLRGIAGKVVLSHRRKNAKSMPLYNEATLEQCEARLAELQSQPGDTFNEKLECLRLCIEQLPVLMQEAIRHRYQLLSSRMDTAAQMNTTAEVVKKRLQRARSRLLDCVVRKLSQQGEGSNGTA